MQRHRPGYLMIQGKYDNAKTWDKVLAKMDHLTDRKPGGIA